MKESRRDARQRRGLAGLLSSVFGEEEPEERVDPLHLAVSVVLMEAASADDDFSDADRDHIAGVLRRQFDLRREEMERLMQVARDERANDPDLWRFTHQINRGCSKKQKLDLMEQVWRLIFADGVLGKHEDQLAHKLGRLLNLDHPELIATKMNAKERE